MHRYIYLTTVLCMNFLSLGCDEATTSTTQTGIFYISNNNNVPLQFKIDTNHFSINKGEVKKITLTNGEHILESNSGEKKVFMVYPGNNGGIINPSQEIYYSFTSVFTSEENKEHFYLDTRSVWINGQLIHGAINSTDAVFIDNNIFRCDIPLNEPIPPYLPDWKNPGVGSVLTKCFSQEEFQTFLAKYPYGIHFDNNHDLLTKQAKKEQFSWINEKDTRTEDFNPTLSEINFNNKELVQEANTIYEIVYSYLASRDPDKKQELYNIYHLHIMSMAWIYSQQIQNDILDDKEAYFQLIKETGRIFGAGILGEPVLI